jgi:hypothetical protein
MLKSVKLNQNNVQITNDVLRSFQSQRCTISTLSMPFCLTQELMVLIKNAVQGSVGLEFPLFKSLSEAGNLSGVYKYSCDSTLLITDSALDIRRFFPTVTLLI